MPSAAMARPGQCGEARHASRSAISPKPIGSARSAIQVGTPSVIVSPAARSTLHERDAAEREDRRDHRADRRRRRRARRRRPRPSGRNSPVASVSSLPSRAAIAAPEHAEPEREVRRERGRSRNRRAEKLARDDLGERQQHDPAERQAGEAVLGLDRERSYRHRLRLTRSRPYLPFVFRKASRSCTAAS